MRHLRTLPTGRLIAGAATLVALLVAMAAFAVAATGTGGGTPAPAPLPNAIQAALAAPAPAGITARVTFTNRLFPSGALLGNAGPVLVSGGSGRLWLASGGRGRLELQSNVGDTQIVWNDTSLFVYDASSNTVYKAALPAGSKDTAGAPPSLATITDALAKLGGDLAISGAQPSNVAGQPAYTVSVSPKQEGGLLGSVELAWDAARGVPLRAAVYAKGSTAPVLELTADEVSYGPVADGTVEITPPRGAKVVDLGALAPPSGHDGATAPVTGLAGVQAALGFPLDAPDSLAGVPRSGVRLAGGKTAVVVYGEGPGAVVVVERAAGAGKTPLASLPTVSLGGLTAHELATPLGTVLEWRSNGVSLTLAGSITAATAETAARELG
jgi:outer membrane lipoprotein-sorting protein